MLGLGKIFQRFCIKKRAQNKTKEKASRKKTDKSVISHPNFSSTLKPKNGMLSFETAGRC